MNATTHGPQPHRSRIRGFVELVLTVAVAVGASLAVRAFLVKPYSIPTQSMVPTLEVGQRILVNRLDTHPGLGAIVVFHTPVGAPAEGEDSDGRCGAAGEGYGTERPCDAPYGGESTQTFVKRVVGLPGDRLKIVDGKVYRNGVQEQGAYIQTCGTEVGVCTFLEVITVPKGDYYMMGDNRGDSDDSRYWGPISQRWIIGVAFATYWPLHRIGGV